MKTVYRYLAHYRTAAFLLIYLLCSAATTSADIRVHEVFMADQPVHSINHSAEPEPVNLHLSAMGRDMVLQLQPSRLNRVSKLAGMSEHAIPALYEGSIEGDANSWARISIENGKPSGYLFHYGKLLQLDSRSQIHSSVGSDDKGSQLVLVETASAENAASLLQSLNMPVDKELFAPVYNFSDSNAFHPDKKTNNLAATLTSRNAVGTGVTRAMRIGIVIDSRFNETHQNRGLARALSIINSVDAIYQSQLGIAVIVEGIRVYDNPATDPMRNNSGSVDQILGNFRPIRNADSRLPNDLTLVHLFSGHRDPNRVIGLGWISTACRLDGYDLSLSTPFPFDALLAAHEIAHNLGALHDDNPQCMSETDKRSNTLMWPELSGASTAEFSNCSTRSMQASIYASCNQDNIDVGVRLRTLPSSEFLRRSIIVDIINKDALLRPTEVISRTVFPLGTVIEDLSAGCRVVNNIVQCNHGTVKARTSHSASMSATLLSESRENVSTELELLNATDIQSNDNRAVVQLLTFDESSGEAIAAASQVIDDDISFQQTDVVSGIGNTSALSLLVLFILSRTRRRLPG